jgi:hypothetical protein
VKGKEGFKRIRNENKAGRRNQLVGFQDLVARVERGSENSHGPLWSFYSYRGPLLLKSGEAIDSINVRGKILCITTLLFGRETKGVNSTIYEGYMYKKKIGDIIQQ